MVSRVRLQAVGVAVVVVLAGAFAFVGFEVAEHETTVETRVGTSSTNGASLSVPATLRLYVVGPDPVRDDVERTVVAALADRGVEPRVVTGLEPAYDQPVLMVAVRESRLSYNPVTPSATAAVWFQYAADGNVSQFGRASADADFDAALVDDRLLNGESVPVVLDEENTLFRSGEVRLTDASTGLVSWPGYRAHVLGELGEHCVSTVFADAR